MLTINMLSSADKVKGQGVGSAYIEQVNLVRNGLKDQFKICVNQLKFADIMHYHTFDPKFYLMLPLSRMRSVNVAYVHLIPETVDDSLTLPKCIQKLLYRYIISFYKNMDYLITVNPLIIKRLEEYGISRDKVTYIPNFVSNKNFYELDHQKKMELRDQYGIARDQFVVMSAGQVQTRKGVLDFVRIAEELKDVQFLWAGGFSFGRITAGYKELSRVMEAPPSNVRFLGILDRDRMNEIYNISNLLFMPSYQETSSMTSLEAFNCRVPVLLRDLEIYPDLFFDFYNKGSTNEEFIAIIKKLKEDKEYYGYWCGQSWKGHEHYSDENVLSIWRDFYCRIAQNRPVRRQKARIGKA